MIVLAGMMLTTAKMPVGTAASQTDINNAIELGYVYLNRTQAPDGHWGGGWSPVACTAMAVLSFENAPNNHFSWNLSDPYHTTVQKGLDWLFSHAAVQAIGAQPAGDPDTNGNGIGIYFSDGSPIYETPMALMAIVASQGKANVTTTGPANVVGRTYYDIVVDIVDYLAWAQNEGGAGRGGWRYYPNYGSSDNSVSQWPVLGLMTAEMWGITAPGWVKSELLNYWATYSQNLDGNYDTNYFYGSFGYDGRYTFNSIAETAAGILELTYCNVSKTDPRIIAAQGYIVRDWYSTSGWRVNLGNFYAMYAVMKACREALPPPQIDFIANYTGYPTIEWYNGTGQYADLLIGNQALDGHWDQWVAPEGVHTDLSTAWAILILIPRVVPSIKYTLTVHVVDDNTNMPIPGANVTVVGLNVENRSGITDGGMVVFNGTDAGPYTITASRTGYFDGSMNIYVSDDTDTTIRLVSKLRHDVAVTDVAPDADWVYQGKLCHAGVNVTVANLGEAPENFTVTLYALNDTAIPPNITIGTQNVADLPPNETLMLRFVWNSSEATPCHWYNITAVASTVLSEIDIDNNVKSSLVLVKVRLFGDVDGDGKVDMVDIGFAAAAFGETPSRPRWLPWGPYADVTNDEKVNLFDIAWIAKNFGRTCL
jgi:hypothetical protein